MRLISLGDPSPQLSVCYRTALYLSLSTPSFKNKILGHLLERHTKIYRHLVLCHHEVSQLLVYSMEYVINAVNKTLIAKSRNIFPKKTISIHLTILITMQYPSEPARERI